jgi:outer membrane biosynthesis protein TonB
MSTTPPPPPPQPTPTPEPTPEPDKAPEKDWQAEAEKWKALSRKHEDTAKANADKAKRLDELEESQKTELQKAADAAAKAQADAAAARAELAVKSAALKHKLSDEDLDLLGTHGTAEEIDARAERLAARLKAAADSKPKPDFGGGDRGEDVGSKAGQLTREDMKRMSPEQIVEASEKGQFDDLLKPT